MRKSKRMRFIMKQEDEEVKNFYDEKNEYHQIDRK